MAEIWLEIIVVALDVRGQAGGEKDSRELVQPRIRQQPSKHHQRWVSIQSCYNRWSEILFSTKNSEMCNKRESVVHTQGKRRKAGKRSCLWGPECRLRDFSAAAIKMFKAPSGTLPKKLKQDDNVSLNREYDSREIIVKNKVKMLAMKMVITKRKCP